MARRYPESNGSGRRSAAQVREDPCRALHSWGSRLLHQDNFGFSIQLVDEDIDALTCRDCHCLTHDVRMNRQLSSAAIDEDSESNSRRPAKVSKLVERSSHSASGVKNVVDNHHVAVVQTPWQL